MNKHPYIYTEIGSVWGYIIIPHVFLRSGWVFPSPASTMECWHSVAAVMLDHIPSSGLRPLTPAIGMLAGNREALNHSIVITFEQIEKPGPRLIAISPKTQDGNKLWGLLSQDGASSHTMHQLRTTPRKGWGLCGSSLSCFQLSLLGCWSCPGQTKITQRQSTQ